VAVNTGRAKGVKAEGWRTSTVIAETTLGALARSLGADLGGDESPRTLCWCPGSARWWSTRSGSSVGGRGPAPLWPRAPAWAVYRGRSTAPSGSSRLSIVAAIAIGDNRVLREHAHARCRSRHDDLDDLPRGAAALAAAFLGEPVTLPIGRGRPPHHWAHRPHPGAVGRAECPTSGSWVGVDWRRSRARLGGVGGPSQAAAPRAGRRSPRRQSGCRWPPWSCGRRRWARTAAGRPRARRRRGPTPGLSRAGRLTALSFVMFVRIRQVRRRGGRAVLSSKAPMGSRSRSARVFLRRAPSRTALLGASVTLPGSSCCSSDHRRGERRRSPRQPPAVTRGGYRLENRMRRQEPALESALLRTADARRARACAGGATSALPRGARPRGSTRALSRFMLRGGVKLGGVVRGERGACR